MHYSAKIGNHASLARSVQIRQLLLHHDCTNRELPSLPAWRQSCQIAVDPSWPSQKAARLDRPMAL